MPDPVIDNGGASNAGNNAGGANSNANANNAGNTPSPPAWTAQLPENLRSHEALTGHQTIGDLAGDYVKVKGTASELEGKMKKALFLPGKDAKPEERDAFFTALGRPNTPEEYSFKKPDNLPEGMPYDVEGEKKFRKLLFDEGVPDAVAQKLFAAYHEEAVGAWTGMQEKAMELHNKNVKALETKWGDKYVENATKAFRVAELMGPEVAKYFDQTRRGDDPVLTEGFYNLYELIGEATIGEASTKTGGVGGSAADALFPEMAAKQNQ